MTLPVQVLEQDEGFHGQVLEELVRQVKHGGEVIESGLTPEGSPHHHMDGAMRGIREEPGKLRERVVASHQIMMYLQHRSQQEEEEEGGAVSRPLFHHL